MILLLVACFHMVSLDVEDAMKKPNSNIYEEPLSRIEIINDTLLQTIFKEVVSEDEEHSEMYVVIMNDYYEGTIVEITKPKDNVLDQALYWNGYTLLNEGKFVIARIYSNYKLNYFEPKQTEMFRIACHNTSLSHSPKWFYYILGDIYARFSPEDGWIWSDGKPDE